MSERDLEILILDALNKTPGCFAFKYKTHGNVGSDGVFKKQHRFVLPGTSDVIAIYNGVFCAVEVKAPTGRVSDRQSAFIEKIIRCGGRAGVAKTVEEALTIVLGVKRVA